MTNFRFAITDDMKSYYEVSIYANNYNQALKLINKHMDDIYDITGRDFSLVDRISQDTNEWIHGVTESRLVK